MGKIWFTIQGYGKKSGKWIEEEKEFSGEDSRNKALRFAYAMRYKPFLITCVRCEDYEDYDYLKKRGVGQ